MFLNWLFKLITSDPFRLWVQSNTIKLLLITILFSATLFLVQNVIFAKYLDMKKIKSTLPLNRLFMYPLFVALVLSYVVLFWRNNSFKPGIINYSFDFANLNATNVPISFIIDQTHIGFVTTTILIGFLVNIFVPIYMRGENDSKRFWNLLNTFLFSMLLLLCANNMLTFLLFWEAIGFFSYFLINYWNKKASTFKSAMKAFTYNQISDVSLLVAITIYYKAYGSFAFPTQTTVLLLTPDVNASTFTTMVTFFMVAASCKSAQFLFHYWLPDSMDAPVPASALIHSATLVAAGVFLIVKIKPLLILTPHVNTVFSFLALLTIVVGGLSAAYQSDVKKILAYSTVSNCGFMVFFAINSTVQGCFIYFSAHGILKAMSFILAGLLVVTMQHKQDYKYSSTMKTTNSFVAAGIFITAGSLGGLPLTIMSTIKHGAVLTTMYSTTQEYITDIAVGIGILTSAVYSLKLIVMTSASNNPKIKPKGFRRSNISSPKSLTAIIAGLVHSMVFLIVLTVVFSKPNIIQDFTMLNDFCITETQGSYLFYREAVLRVFSVIYISSLFFLALPTWLSTQQKYITTVTTTVLCLNTIPSLL